MKPSELTETLSYLIPAREPTLIVGPPGVGKSQIVELSTLQAKAKMIVSHPAVGDPTDVKGLPWAAKGASSATFLPFGDLQTALNAKELTVWFLDDLGQATPAVQASYMQLILARRVNDHKLPDCVTFIAATNRRTDRAGVSGILEPVKSRFVILTLEPDLDDWCRWAFANDVPPEMVAFLRFRTDLLCAFNPSADMDNSPLPRTWAAAARHSTLGMNDQLLFKLISGDVGAGAAGEYMSFRQLAEAVDLDDVLLHPDTCPIPEKPELLYAVATGLAARNNKKLFRQVTKFASRLANIGKGEFAVLLMRDCIERDDTLSREPEWVELVAGPMGDLIGGAA